MGSTTNGESRTSSRVQGATAFSSSSSSDCWSIALFLSLRSTECGIEPYSLESRPSIAQSLGRRRASPDDPRLRCSFPHLLEEVAARGEKERASHGLPYSGRTHASKWRRRSNAPCGNSRPRDAPRRPLPTADKYRVRDSSRRRRTCVVNVDTAIVSARASLSSRNSRSTGNTTAPCSPSVAIVGELSRCLPSVVSSKRIQVSQYTDHLVSRCSFVQGRMRRCEKCGLAKDTVDSQSGVDHPLCRR